MSTVPNKCHGKSGFTLTEVVVAASILLMAVTLALSGYLFSLKNTHQADIQSELDTQVQLAIEMLKTDMRLSSMSLVSYYPAVPPYTAISFPIAYDTDGDGMLQREDKAIIWNDTVIYHIRVGTPNELVRTSFSPRDNTMDLDARFDQLEAVVENGGDDQATSRSIFKNLLNWELNPREGRFNGYDTIHTFEEDVFLGYALLDNGDHEITFEAVEAGDGGGYNIGIDQLMASPASTPNEGESLTVESQVGTSASVLLDRQAKGNFQLHFPATQKGHKFSITVHNDKWVETNFEDPASIEDVEIEFNETLIPNDIVVRLAGMEPAWNASRQTGSLSYGTPGLDLNGTVVRQLQKGDSILNGGFIETEGKRSRLIFKASNAQAFRIENVYFGISASDEAVNMGYRYTPERLKLTSNAGTESSAYTIPAGQSITSSWSNIEITSTNNYLVTYSIADNVNRDSPAVWPDYNVASNTALSSTRLAFIGGGASYTAASLAQEAGNWDSLSNTNGLTMYSPLHGIGLEAIQVCYAPTGSFTSRILDTTLASPTYEGFTSNAETPGGSSIQFKVRTGDENDLSDASDWDLIEPSSQIMDSNKRYLQFQALLESDTSHTETPILKDVTFNWSGEPRMVNIGGTFNKGPDHGVFEISVDGQKLTSALIVDMEIYQDVRAMNNTTRRIQSKQKVEISPRNTGF